MPIDEQTIAELLELYERVNGEDWVAGPRALLGTGVAAVSTDVQKDGPLIACWSAEPIGADLADDFAHFIAAAKNLLPALLTAASNEARLQREVEALRAALIKCKHQYEGALETAGYMAQMASTFPRRIEHSVRVESITLMLSVIDLALTPPAASEEDAS